MKPIVTTHETWLDFILEQTPFYQYKVMYLTALCCASIWTLINPPERIHNILCNIKQLHRITPTSQIHPLKMR
jgi:hypothetical protein